MGCLVNFYKKIFTKNKSATLKKSLHFFENLVKIKQIIMIIIFICVKICHF